MRHRDPYQSLGLITVCDLDLHEGISAPQQPLGINVLDQQCRRSLKGSNVVEPFRYRFDMPRLRCESQQPVWRFAHALVMHQANKYSLVYLKEALIDAQAGLTCV